MSDGDNNSDEDLTKELEPLAYYVSDRKRVLREALKTLKGKRLEAMVPPVLKSWERPRLESACLNILENLDDEKLLAILDGRIGTASVAAVEQHDDEPEEPVAEEKVKKSKSKLKKVKSVNALAKADEPKKKKKKRTVATVENLDELKAAKLKKKKKLLKAKKLKEKLKKKKKAAAAAVTSADGEPSAAAPHKSLMELLELEYRAKAIKALLRSQGQTVPDIPMDIEDEEENDEKPDVTKANNKQNTSTVEEVNGDVTSVPADKKRKKKLPTATPTPSTETDTPIKQSQIKKSVPTKSPSTSKLPTTSKPSPVKSSSPDVASKSGSPQNKPEPKKKAVIDMIDDALNSSFSEISDTPSSSSPQTLQPPSVIIEACTSKGPGTEEDLRSKLLRKYQQQKQQQEAKTTVPALTVATVVSKKKKKKNKPSRLNEEEEDILDLHPQELCLTDEDRSGMHNAGENESSADEEAEEEENEEETNELVPDNNVAQKPDIVSNTQDEELDYDNTDEEEQAAGDDEETEQVLNRESAEEDTSNQENSLWADMVERDAGGEKIPLDDNESTQGSVPIGDPPSDNSRSGVFSETTRDDVFEKAVPEDSKVKVGMGIAFGGAIKRKLTFRIDPARIKALEEQAAEEEAKRAEERRKLEEEERLRKLEEEPEEGEIDSNEEDYVSELKEEQQENGKAAPVSGKPQEKFRPPSPSPPKQRVTDTHSEDSPSDSEDSQDSSSYYGRRRPYKRKAMVTSPNRDFGKYSPQRAQESSNKNEDNPSKKRPSSPVDFITQFSDMEPVSDDDDSNQSQPRKKVGPVQGCATKPPNAVTSSDDEDKEDLNKQSAAQTSKSGGGKSESEENKEEEDEDELPKPVTWYERWAQSHGMSKVVKANKIHRKVKSKLKQVKSATKKEQHPQLPKVPEPSVEAEPIIGSIQEYEKLFGKKVVVKNSEQEDPDISKQPEEDEEEDADDLWGDIMGGS